MKALIISHNAFSSSLNNGKTLESIFKDFPKENICQLFFSQNEYPDFDFCENYFKITDLDVLKNMFSISSQNGGKCFPINNKINYSSAFKLAKRSASYLYFIRDLLWLTNKWRTPELLNWLKQTKPDFIFFVGGNLGFSHDIAVYISRFLKIPLTVYFTDDYLIYPRCRNIFDVIQKHRMKYFYKRTIESASLCFSIGEQMSSEYSKYFNKPFFPVMNMVDLSDYKPEINDSLLSHDIVISYFGGLHLGRWKMIAEIGELIAQNIKLNECQKSIVLKVYTSSEITTEIAVAFKKANISINSAIYDDELKNAITKSTFLLHVESDDSYYRSLTKLSVSTKIPEYLLSSRCIIAYGPSEVASLKLILDNNLGYVISTDLPEQVKSEILADALSDKSQYIIKATNAITYLKTKFDSNEIRKNLYGMFGRLLSNEND